MDGQTDECYQTYYLSGMWSMNDLGKIKESGKQGKGLIIFQVLSVMD